MSIVFPSKIELDFYFENVKPTQILRNEILKVQFCASSDCCSLISKAFDIVANDEQSIGFTRRQNRNETIVKRLLLSIDSRVRMKWDAIFLDR